MVNRPFEEHVRRALDALPPQIAKRLENVAVVVEEANREEPDLYGLFETPEWMPSKITIYRRPLERLWGADPTRLRREIRRVVLHEVAHHFGISDERLIEIDRY